MSEIEKRVEQYVEHWESVPSAPASIGWLEVIFNKWRRGIWRPLDEDGNHYVDHRMIAHSRSTFEELIPDYDTQSQFAVSSSRISAAQKTELRHRLFKSIYWGNLFDEITPIESRSYTYSGSRIVKLIFMTLAAWFFVALITLLPSYLNDSFFEESALTKTSNSRLSFYLEKDDLAERFLDSTGVSLNPNMSFTSGQTLDPLALLVAIRQDTQKVVAGEQFDATNWLQEMGWRASSDEERSLAIIDAVFFHRVLNDPATFKLFNSSTRFIVTPSNNWQEIFSQLAIVSFIVCMISWFLAKKGHFYEVVDRMELSKRIPSVMLLEGILISFFFLRKKYHYLVALFAASVTIFFHYYTMNKIGGIGNSDVAIALNLTPFDYRLKSSSQPLLATYWLVQFAIIYMFTLVAWELGALNACFRQWQGQLLKAGLITRELFNSEFKPLVKDQKQLLAACIILIMMALGGLSVLKLIQSYPDNSGNAIVGSFNANRFLNWEVLRNIYFFSPPFLSIIVVVYALNPCFKDPESAEKYCVKKLPDVERVLQSAWESWKKIKSTMPWLAPLIGSPSEEKRATDENKEGGSDV